MKHNFRTNRLLALALALIMALALCVPTMAANDVTEKTITIENSESGQTYTAYKVFDMTKTSDDEDAGYVYTIDDSVRNKMFDLVLGYMGKTRDAEATIYEQAKSGEVYPK